MFSGFLNFSCESFVTDALCFDTFKINLCACSQCVNLVHSLYWYSINFIWSCNCKKSRLELFEEHYSFSSKSSGKKDKNTAWYYPISNFGSTFLLFSSELFLHIIRFIPLVFLDHLSSKQSKHMNKIQITQIISKKVKIHQNDSYYYW